jgi:poly(3-hydroxybutyrate) depolymerase
VDGAGGGATGDGGACGTRTGMRGKTTRTVMVDGKTRSYVAYLPRSASATAALPFVYVFHGARQNGSELFDITQYSALADSEGIAVVFPDGQGTSSITDASTFFPWNVSGQRCCRVRRGQRGEQLQSRGL